MPSITELFKPITIGKVTVPNRIVSTAHGTGFATQEGLFTEKHVQYHGARARGGVGLIVIESTYVRPPYWPTEAGLARDDQIEGLAKVVTEIHRFGSKVFVQLHHAGRELREAVAGQPPCGPSVPPDSWQPLHRIPFDYSPPEKARELTIDEIQQIIEDFVGAALRAQKAGADGIEIHGAHGYIVSHFLSPVTNLRKDQYGGSAEGRTRIAREIIAKIKELAGEDFVVGIRINGNDFVKGGITSETAAQQAKFLERAGADYISVSGGFYGSYPATILPMGEPPGIFTSLAAKVKETVDVPIITVGRINDPRLAEQVLREGKADLVGMTRALVADPELPVKAKCNDFGEIRKCIGCLACIDRMMDSGIRCLVNPEVGREGQVEIRKTPAKKRVMVIGAGPAGLKAAETATLRGHEVVMFEKQPFLGGKLLYAEMVPTRREMREPVRFLEERLHALGIEIKWAEADLRTIEEEAPDEVLVAVGAQAVLPDETFAGGPKAFHVVDVFAQQAELGLRVAVLGGTLIALQTADWLAERGKEVTVVVPQRKLLPEFYGVTLFYLRNRLGMNKVNILKPAVLEKVEGKTLIVNHNGQTTEIKEIDNLIYTEFEANKTLAKQISQAGYSTKLIGSARQVGLAVDAIRDGFDVARNI